MVPPKLPPPVNPALVQHAEARAADVQNRIADAITRFSGSMAFVYLHVVHAYASAAADGIHAVPIPKGAPR
jgi:hypothetical protein